MTMYYTPRDDEYLRQKAAREGRPAFDLVLCQDGIYRTPDEKTAWEYSNQVPFHAPLIKGNQNA